MRESNLVEKIKAACMACAIPVLLYLAFTISVYGDTVDANGNNLSGGVESSSDLVPDKRHAATTTSREAVKEGVDRDNIMDASSHSGSSAPSAQNLPPAELYARLIDERYIPWTEPAILKGNSFADQLRE